MRLSASTTLFCSGAPDGGAPLPERIRRAAEAGFTALDINFCDGSVFKDTSWEKEAEEAAKTASKYGILFSQAHLPFYGKHRFGSGNEEDEAFVAKTLRAVSICRILGVHWAVAHSYALSDPDSYDSKADLELNLRNLSPVLSVCKRNGIGLAVENIVGMRPPLRRRFTAVSEELCELVDRFDDCGLGACWDFGHGNRMYADQRRALRQVGTRLKATHLNDNMRTFDSHTLPFVYGNTDWEMLLPVLSEIGYDGDLALEVKFHRTLPAALQAEYHRLAFEIGRHCLKLAEGTV